MTRRQRETLDQYFTPDEAALTCCAALASIGVLPETITEPSAGKGAWVRAASATWPQARVSGFDFDPTMGWPVRDAGMSVAPADLIVGNPPYNEAARHLEVALEASSRWVAFLLRLSALEVVEGRNLYNPHLSRIWTLVGRPKFVGTGSDNVTSAFILWDKAETGSFARIQPLWWKPDDAPKKRHA